MMIVIMQIYDENVNTRVVYFMLIVFSYFLILNIIKPYENS
jgi:hypothetical protein